MLASDNLIKEIMASFEGRLSDRSDYLLGESLRLLVRLAQLEKLAEIQRDVAMSVEPLTIAARKTET